MVTAMNALKQRGHHVTLVCRPNGEILSHAKEIGVDVIPLRMKGDFDPVTILQIFWILKKKEIDVILTNMDKELRLAGIAARLAKVRTVICRKGIDFPLKNNLRYRFTYNKLATKIVANSLATKTTLLENAPWLNPARIHVIYNGINPDLYLDNATRDLRKELNIPNHVPLVGFVGRLNVQKGISYLLEAFDNIAKENSRVQFLVAGDGDLKDEMISFAKEKGFYKRLTFTGFRKDIANVMRTIDILVLPSLWEGFGIVLIEAMAAKKPCITTQISSMPEIVGHNVTGLVVPPKDIKSLTSAMLKLINDEQLAKQMGENGRKLVMEKFSLDKMIEDYEQLFYA